MHTLTTFERVPPHVVGYVRDLRVRWALEEAGQRYGVETINFEGKQSPAYRMRQPFGQVPVLCTDGFSLFETGAILLHIGEHVPALMPQDEAGRKRTIAWMFAALNSVEPHIANLCNLLFFQMDQPWAKDAKPSMEEMALKRLGDLDAWLKGRIYLTDERFTAADILMATVLRLLDATDYVSRFPAVSAYLQRCIERPAFVKALADQTALFTQKQAAAG